jgi:hypothetical protein
MHIQAADCPVDLLLDVMCGLDEPTKAPGAAQRAFHVARSAGPHQNKQSGLAVCGCCCNLSPPAAMTLLLLVCRTLPTPVGIAPAEMCVPVSATCTEKTSTKASTKSTSKKKLAHKHA